jgi:hypothetical protein
MVNNCLLIDFISSQIFDTGGFFPVSLFNFTPLFCLFYFIPQFRVYVASFLNTLQFDVF